MKDNRQTYRKLHGCSRQSQLDFSCDGAEKRAELVEDHQAPVKPLQEDEINCSFTSPEFTPSRLMPVHVMTSSFAAKLCKQWQRV